MCVCVCGVCVCVCVCVHMYVCMCLCVYLCLLSSLVYLGSLASADMLVYACGLSSAVQPYILRTSLRYRWNFYYAPGHGWVVSVSGLQRAQLVIYVCGMDVKQPLA